MIAPANTTDVMRVRIHRGCHEIGGNCIEIEYQDQRILLDIGLPLSELSPATLPEVSGLTTPDESLLGIFISHPHPDHYGFLEQVTQEVPVYMGAAAARIVQTSSFFTPLPGLGEIEPRELVDQEPIQLGSFTITPMKVDHSAFDSYCLLIQAGEKRLLYTGDLRGHGRNGERFERLVTQPPGDVDVLICEGTRVGREPDFEFESEESVAASMAELFTGVAGLAMVWCSSQNIDRLVSVLHAAQQSGRRLIVDMYTAEIIRAAQHPELPSIDRGEMKVYLPWSQKRRIKSEKAFHIVAPYYPHRIYPEQLADAASRSVMICRPSMLRELRDAQCFDGAVFVSSLWSGYVHRSKEQLSILRGSGAQQAMLVRSPVSSGTSESEKPSAVSVARHHIHTSGHATLEHLQRLIAAFPASRIVPIHLDNPDEFAKLTENVELKNDHQWWEI